MRTVKQWVQLLCLTLIICGLQACGGGDDPAAPAPLQLPPVVTVAAGQSTQQTLGATGGSVTLTTNEGAVFALTVPAGALNVPTAMTIATQAITGTQKFNIRLLPAGLVLLDGIQATMAMTLPANITLPTNTTVSYDGVPVPFQRTSNTLTVLIASFASGAPSANASSFFAKIKPFAIAGKQASAASAVNCGSPQALDASDGGLTAEDAVSAELYGQCMVAAVNALVSSNEHEEAIRVANSVAAYLQSVGSGDAGGFITQARTIACAAYRNVLDNAGATQVTTMGTLHDLVRPILYWEAAVQKLGATCASVGTTEYDTVITAKTSEAMTYYASQAGAIVDIDSVGYTEAMQEARDARDTVQQIESLQPSPAVTNVLTIQIEQRAQTSLLDAILHAPFKACRENGNYAELISLMTAFDNPASVRNAAQYCGTTLGAQSFDANSAPIATLTPSLGGRLNGQDIEVAASGTISVPRNGSLSLSGPINALACPASNAGGTESLEIRFNNVVVQTLTNAPYLSANLQLTITQLLAAANITPENFSSGTLTLTRTGSPCNDFWGTNPQPLLTLTLRGGTCQPQQGHSFCYTPIEIPGSRNIGYYQLRSLNDRGEVLFYEYESQTCVSTENFENAPCAGVWRNGQVRMLPNRFQPNGGMSNDGTVAGTQYSGTNMAKPAVVTSGSTSSIELATPIPYTNGDPPSGTGYMIDSISPNGRVTYHQVRGGYSYSLQDYGFCRSTTTTYTTMYCWFERFFETSGPNYGAGSAIHTSQLPSDFGRTEILFDNDSHGRGGTIGRYFSSDYFSSQNFTNGDADIILHMVDSNGARLIYDRTDSTFELRDSSITVPTGYEPKVLGSNGHGLMISTSLNSNGNYSVRLFDSNQNSVSEAFDQVIEFQINSVTAITSIPNDALQRGERRVDGLGRILAAASSDDIPRLRGVILTPAGVALP